MTGERSDSQQARAVRFILERGSSADFDAILEHFAADAVWAMPMQEFAGVEAIRVHWEEWYQNYDTFRFGAPEITDFGSGVVLAIVVQGGQLRGGAGELSQELALIYEWSDGKVVRVTASAAAGDIAEAGANAERIARARA